MRIFTWLVAAAVLAVGSGLVVMATTQIELPRPAVLASGAQAMPLARLMVLPQVYDGVLVRVAGYCQIEFEGNRIAENAALESTRSGVWAVWLQLGWPVDSQVRQLSGQYCAVEGVVNANMRGHFGMFRASLDQIRLIEASTIAREQAFLVSEETP
jgi:hypothetical protein